MLACCRPGQFAIIFLCASRKSCSRPGFTRKRTTLNAAMVHLSLSLGHPTPSLCSRLQIGAPVGQGCAKRARAHRVGLTGRLKRRLPSPPRKSLARDRSASASGDHTKVGVTVRHALVTTSSRMRNPHYLWIGSNTDVSGVWSWCRVYRVDCQRQRFSLQPSPEPARRPVKVARSARGVGRLDESSTSAGYPRIG